jgi:PadR family transcriptional regulator PadR
MEIEREMLKGYIDIIILSVLMGRDYYGYELGKRVKELTGNIFGLKEGTLYVALKRLERGGLVVSYWDGENYGGRRKYYRLLPAGVKHLGEKKKQWKLIKNVIDLFLKGVNTNGEDAVP